MLWISNKLYLTFLNQALILTFILKYNGNMNSDTRNTNFTSECKSLLFYNICQSIIYYLFYLDLGVACKTLHVASQPQEPKERSDKFIDSCWAMPVRLFTSGEVDIGRDSVGFRPKF